MSLEHASSLTETNVARRTLELPIRNNYEAQKTLWQHAVVPFLNPKALFTTNYDNLIELGYQIHCGGDNVDKIQEVYGDLNYSEQFVPVFKPHGSISKKNSEVLNGCIVITHFDVIRK